VQDLQDNYQFLYPFGWQEVSIDGADVVYKARHRDGAGPGPVALRPGRGPVADCFSAPPPARRPPPPTPQLPACAPPQDVVEPLESVSVTLTPTEKKDIKEFGGIKEVRGAGVGGGGGGVVGGERGAAGAHDASGGRAGGGLAAARSLPQAAHKGPRPLA
jgi:hypothetical protein